MINALIVLYNKRITDSLTFKYLKKRKNINLIIFDNSTENYRIFNSKYCFDKNISYYTLYNNVGIAKAYNYAIDKIDLNDCNYLIILDDDTVLNDDYFNEMNDLVNNTDYDVILPKIYAKKMYISPCTVQFGCRIKAINDFNNINYNTISAINSGMIIKTSVYIHTRYNEKLFLDYVDHDFMKNVRDNKYNVCIMKSVINQNYSRFEIKDVNSELFRFKIYLKDFKIYCKDCNNMFFYYLSTIKYRIQLFFKYRNIKFITIK